MQTGPTGRIWTGENLVIRWASPDCNPTLMDDTKFKGNQLTSWLRAAFSTFLGDNDGSTSLALEKFQRSAGPEVIKSLKSY